MFRAFFLLFALMTLSACTQKDASPKESKPLTAEQLKSRGLQIYMTHCTSCHNAHPTRDGSVGPAVAGSSLEVIRSRITGGTYPAGYKPKRTTGLMPPLPHLAPEVEALAAYLSNFPVKDSP